MDQYNVASWLQDYFSESVNCLCTTINCTLCGATEFRKGLLVELARAVDEPQAPRIGRRQAKQLIHFLRYVEPPQCGTHIWEWESAVRLTLFLAWAAPTKTSEMEESLAETWAGEVLSQMRAHHCARQKAIARQNDLNDPVKAKARREEKKRQRQIKHAKRLAAKKERDRKWRQQNGEVEK